MSEVKPSPQLSYRQWQALETKRRIARAARQVFAEGGYAESSVEMVARTAGVAVRTVYAAFGGKKPILAAICDQWLVESDVPGLVTEVMGEADDRLRLALVARLNRRQWELGQDVVPMLEAAAAADPEVARMLAGWKQQRAQTLGEAMRPLAPRLRRGLDWARAAAVVRALSVPEIYFELVNGAGWTADAYEEWLGELLAGELLDSTSI
jgi:AcrR family transcriptional regulator